MERRLSLVRRHMESNGIDACVFTSYHNIAYFGDFLYCYFGRPYAFIVTAEKTLSVSAGTMLSPRSLCQSNCGSVCVLIYLFTYPPTNKLSRWIMVHLHFIAWRMASVAINYSTAPPLINIKWWKMGCGMWLEMTESLWWKSMRKPQACAQRLQYWNGYNPVVTKKEIKSRPKARNHGQLFRPCWVSSAPVLGRNRVFYHRRLGVDVCGFNVYLVFVISSHIPQAFNFPSLNIHRVETESLSDSYISLMCFRLITLDLPNLHNEWRILLYIFQNDRMA